MIPWLKEGAECPHGGREGIVVRNIVIKNNIRCFKSALQ